MPIGLKIKGNKEILIINLRICTQQNHCFASGCVECLFIMTR